MSDSCLERWVHDSLDKSPIQLEEIPEFWICSTHSLRCNDCKEVAAHPQDFGARDPTAGEVASNFTDRVLGNADTSHIIRQGCLFVINDCFFSADWI